MRYKHAVFGAQHLVEEGVARPHLLLDYAALATARIHQHAESERQIGFAREIADFLFDAVLEDPEIFTGEIADYAAVPIVDRGQHRHNLYVRRKCRLLARPGRGC